MFLEFPLEPVKNWTQLAASVGSLYYFIRPGIRHVITHIVPIDAGVSLIRVTAGFYYVKGAAYPHTARRVFPTAVVPVPNTISPR
jgi:hypothetical protein